MNKLTIRCLCSNLIKNEILATALTFWLAFLHSPSMCSSKVNLLSTLISKNFFTACTWRLLIANIHLMTFFITKKKVKYIWIHFHTVILKPQSESFRHTLNYHPLQMEYYYLHKFLSRHLASTERDRKERH